MDIANYLSELLSQHGEVNVPGLGYFVHSRVKGYYNDAEGKFYPPGYAIQFDQQTIDDEDTLTKYIADSKKISLASSKYFTEKYIAGLKTEVALQDVPFADLGWFYMDKGRISFRAEEKHGSSASVFGYQPINVKKLTSEQGTFTVKTTTVVLTPPLPLPAPPPLPAQMPVQIQVQPQPQAQPITEQQPEEYVTEEQETKRSISIWIIAAIIVAIFAVAAFGLYEYKPGLFDRQGEQIQQSDETKELTKPVLKADTDTTKIVAPTIDTPAKTISKPDSALNKSTVIANKPVTAVADTFTRTRYELLAGAFKKEIDANYTIAQYKKLGFIAHIVKNVPGKLVKVSLGTYFIRDEAVAAKQKFVSTGKIKEDKITIQPYNPKK